MKPVGGGQTVKRRAKAGGDIMCDCEIVVSIISDERPLRPAAPDENEPVSQAAYDNKPKERSFLASHRAKYI